MRIIVGLVLALATLQPAAACPDATVASRAVRERVTGSVYVSATRSGVEMTFDRTSRIRVSYPKFASANVTEYVRTFAVLTDGRAWGLHNALRDELRANGEGAFAQVELEQLANGDWRVAAWKLQTST